MTLVSRDFACKYAHIKYRFADLNKETYLWHQNQVSPRIHTTIFLLLQYVGVWHICFGLEVAFMSKRFSPEEDKYERRYKKQLRKDW